MEVWVLKTRVCRVCLGWRRTGGCLQPHTARLHHVWNVILAGNITMFTAHPLQIYCVKRSTTSPAADAFLQSGVGSLWVTPQWVAETDNCTRNITAFIQTAVSQEETETTQWQTLGATGWLDTWRDRNLESHLNQQHCKHMGGEVTLSHREDRPPRLYIRHCVDTQVTTSNLNSKKSGLLCVFVCFTRMHAFTYGVHLCICVYIGTGCVYIVVCVCLYKC